jgi:hypothetical protein
MLFYHSTTTLKLRKLLAVVFIIIVHLHSTCAFSQQQVEDNDNEGNSNNNNVTSTTDYNDLTTSNSNSNSSSNSSEKNVVFTNYNNALRDNDPINTTTTTTTTMLATLEEEDIVQQLQADNYDELMYRIFIIEEGLQQQIDITMITLEEEIAILQADNDELMSRLASIEANIAAANKNGGDSGGW